MSSTNRWGSLLRAGLAVAVGVGSGATLWAQANGAAWPAPQFHAPGFYRCDLSNGWNGSRLAVALRVTECGPVDPARFWSPAWSATCESFGDCAVPPAACFSQPAPVCLGPTLSGVRREVARCLPRIGLFAAPPAALETVSLSPAEVQLRRQLAEVDWDSAVRAGTRNVVVRGLSREPRRSFRAVPEPTPIEVATRTAVREGVIAGINRSAADAASPPGRFQALVQQGIEDAMVEALNEIGARAPGAVPAEWRRHYTGPLTGDEFRARFPRGELVEAGWVVERSVLPLTGSKEYLVLTLQEPAEQVEVWSEGRLVADRCRFAQFFEDARRLIP